MATSTTIFFRFKNFLKELGPGLITGASDDDPSAITTFSQAGTRFGLSTLWVALFAFPVLAFIQEMCARIGIVTKKGLAGVVKEHYPKWVLYVLIGLGCPSFLLNIGADIAMLGETGNLLFPAIHPLYCSIAFTFLLLTLMLLLSFNGLLRVMKFVCLSLLVYVIVPFFSTLNFKEIVKNTFIPQFHFEKDYFLILIGITGAIISPYLFFWQTATEAESNQAKDGSMPIRNKKKSFITMRKDIVSGAFFAVLIMYFVILATGTVLHQHIYEIRSAEDAAAALKPLAGKTSYVLFSIGVIGTSFLIIPVLSGSISYILGEAFNWKTGFNKSFTEARQFYIIIVIALFIGLGMQLLRISSVKALLCTTVLYGIIAPFLLAIILHIGNNKKIMGRYINRSLTNGVGFAALILMMLSLVVLGYVIIKK